MVPCRGTAVSTDIGNGGSRCVNMTWADGSMSSFLATIVRSVPANYGVYLEEGQRQFVSHGRGAFRGLVSTQVLCLA